MLFGGVIFEIHIYSLHTDFLLLLLFSILEKIMFLAYYISFVTIN